MITSGITSGEFTMPVSSVRPGKRLNRVIATAAKVPSSTDAVAVMSAIFSDNTKPSMMGTSLTSSPYHLNEKPVQVVTSGLSLKLSTIRVTIGRYRNAKPATSQSLDVICPARLIICALPMRLRPGTC